MEEGKKSSAFVLKSKKICIFNVKIFKKENMIVTLSKYRKRMNIFLIFILI